MNRTVTRRAALAVVPDVEPADGELVEEMTKYEAEQITDEIRAGLKDWYDLADRITELALKAYYGLAFRALGYATWGAYAAAKFADLELPRTTQAAVNSALINQGQISARSAAAISGTDHKTAAKDAAKAQESIGEDSPVGKHRTGADGKKRAASKPRSRRQPASEGAPDTQKQGTPIPPEPPQDAQPVRPSGDERLKTAERELDAALRAFNFEIKTLAWTKYWHVEQQTRADCLAEITTTLRALADQARSERLQLRHPWQEAVDQLAERFGWDEQTAFRAVQATLQNLSANKERSTEEIVQRVVKSRY
jgi:hypothetical protein